MKSLLIVDDNVQNRYLLKSLLKGNGYCVTEAENGREALELARKAMPDMIITDLLMPEMDGFELCRIWKTDESLKAIPLMVYTATYTEQQDREFALKLGADSFLVKPTEPEELLREIMQLEMKYESGAQVNPQEPEQKSGEYDKLHDERVTAKLGKKIQDLEFETVRRVLAEEERDILAAAIEQAHDSIVITDTDGVIQYVNKSFQAVTGFTREEALGKKPAILRSGVHSTEFYTELWETIVRGGTWQGKLVNKKKNGEHFTEEALISPILDKSGKVSHYIAVKRDVTELLELERQFRHAQKLESVGLLAGGLAHDFNNLLQGILGYIELTLEDFSGNQTERGHIEQINDMAVRASGLTRQLLAFSRQQVLTTMDLDINEMIQKLADMLIHLIGESVELVVKPCGKAYTIAVDTGQLEQVMVNLCVNARDAMPNGGTLTIETSNVDLTEQVMKNNAVLEPGKYICITVTDTGTGMDRRTLEKIFEPFFSTKDPGKGTGLGLPTVYGIIRQHCGTISVVSTPGEGTTFEIILPAVERASKRIRRERPSLVKGGTEVILVAEDEDSIRTLNMRFLKRAGYRVLGAVNGQEAIDIIRAEGGRVDLALLDLVMPKLGGIEVRDYLKKEYPGIKILFTSGYSSKYAQEDLELNDGSQLLQKPFGSNELLLKIRSQLDEE